jgi:sucrose-6-phosphate hydrolase SacC (GH32 family)
MIRKMFILLLLLTAGCFVNESPGEVEEIRKVSEASFDNLPAQVAGQLRIRELFLSDPHRPTYHFVSFEGRCMPFDPNGAIFWKGRYHLFFIFQDERGHNWGHVSSTDLVHWRYHPTGLIGGGNAFINKEGVPTMCFHDQQRHHNSMAVALDDELNEWKKLALITPKTKEGDKYHDRYYSWDPYGWLEGDTYYAIFGGGTPGIAKCKELEGDWEYVGDLFAHGVEGVSLTEDVSCADMFKIGDKHMLLCISHRIGCRYYLGEWKDEQFYPDLHQRMNWSGGSCFAPESLLDDKGRRIMWAWVLDRREELHKRDFSNPPKYGWSGTMTLPRVLSLDDDGTLLIEPPEELKQLRMHERKHRNIKVKDGESIRLEDVAGNTMELELIIEPGSAEAFGLKVCSSPDGREQTIIECNPSAKNIRIDLEQSSLDKSIKHYELCMDKPNPVVTEQSAPFELRNGEKLQLRIFIDRSILEVFANGRQCITQRIYPTRKDSLGVELFSKGGSMTVESLQAWNMAATNPW